VHAIPSATASSKWTPIIFFYILIEERKAPDLPALPCPAFWWALVIFLVGELQNPSKLHDYQGPTRAAFHL
jgi:hypothetical protein